MATTFLNQTYKVNLLIKEKVKMISKLTSDPKRALETILQYLGIQTKHQHMIGISWFMKQMLRVNNFPHDMQVLARKIVYGYRWRKEETFNSKIKHQCKSKVKLQYQTEFINYQFSLVEISQNVPFKSNGSVLVFISPHDPFNCPSILSSDIIR